MTTNACSSESGGSGDSGASPQTGAGPRESGLTGELSGFDALDQAPHRRRRFFDRKGERDFRDSGTTAVERAQRRANQYAPGGKLSFDDDGRIAYASPEIDRLLGVAPGALIGQVFDRLLTPASRVFYSTHFLPLLKLRHRVEDNHFQFRKGPGDGVAILVSAVRELENDHALTHCAMMEMGQRKQLETALIEARRAAESATVAKDQFLAVISHELRSPLSAILGWARVGQAERTTEAMRLRALHAIERSALAQAQLIDDLLDVARIVNGKMRLNPRFIDLAPVIEAAIDAAHPSAEAKNINLIASIDHQPHAVFADPGRIQQIALNLLSNAIKFTPKDGTIKITLARANSSLQFSVSDTGAGIAIEQLPFVFDRFWQDSVHANPTTGLGLGLAICKTLVELHGGSIRADSLGLGHGASFCVELPLAQAATGLPDHPQPASESGTDRSTGG